MKPILFASLVAVSTVSAAAIATDAHAQPAFNWTGPYIGASVGYGFGDTSWSDIMVPGDSGQNLSGKFSSSDLDGVVGGVQLGYNYQFGQFVAGVEGDLIYANLSGSDVCFGGYGDYSAKCTTEVNWIGDLAVRLGVTPANRVLIYAKGGGSFAEADFAPKNEVGPYSLTDGYRSTSDTRFGFLLGAGVEFAISQHLTAGVEYTYRDYGQEKTKFKTAGVQNSYNPPFSADTDLRVSTVMAKINFKF